MTTVTRQIHFAIKGKRKRMLPGPAPEPAEPQGRVPRVARLMALAIRFDGLLRDSVVINQSELARLCRVSQPRMTHIMNLLHLAPDIQEELLFMPLVTEGRDRIHEKMLRTLTGIDEWQAQRREWSQIRPRQRLAERPFVDPVRD